MDSNCGSFMKSHMPSVVAKHMVKDATLRASAARLLAMRFRLGLFEPDHPAVPRFGLEHVDSGISSDAARYPQ